MSLTQAPAAPILTGDSGRTFEQLFEEHVRAGYQIIYIPTSEEARVEKIIKTVATQQSMGVVTWDTFDSFAAATPTTKLSIPEDKLKDYRDPNAAMRLLGESTDKGSTKTAQVRLPSDTIYILRDMDDFFQAPPIRRALRSLFEGNRLVNDKQRRPVVIISPKLDIHPKLRSAVAIIDFSLPTEVQLGQSVDFLARSLAAKDPAKGAIPPELREQVLNSCRGLTSTEAENALSRCIIRYKGFSPEMLPMLQDEKATIVRKGEVLTYRDESTIVRRDQIGGMENLWEFVDRRAKAYTREARNAQIDNPKGIVLIGVPGTGKSVVAECIASTLKLPLYLMDVGAVFGSLVGESEARMRDAIKQISAQDGSVLLIDEADKAWGNATEGRGDSGVTQRVFGQLLSWLAQKKDRTFCIMTMNRTDGIPPEFLRAGRFDKIFYTDLPNARERQQILDIHLRKRNVDPAQAGLNEANWEAIVEATAGFVGSELEEVARESRYVAFAARGTGMPTFDELFAAAKSIVPLSKLDEEGIKRIRNFCKDRATPVTAEETTRAAGGGRRNRGLNVN